MIVGRVLKNFPRAVLTVNPHQTVGDIATLYETRHSGLAMVCDEKDHLIGVVSMGDIIHVIGERGAEALDLPVRMVMTGEVNTCEPEDDIESALKTMTEHDIRHLPVVSGGRLQGIIEKEDALQVLYDLAALDFAQLRNYVFKTGGRY